MQIEVEDFSLEVVMVNLLGTMRRRHTRPRRKCGTPRGLMEQLGGIAIETDGRSRMDAGANWG